MQGSNLLTTAVSLPGVQCVAAADLYDGRHTLAKEIAGNKIKTTRKYQELLDRKVVIVANLQPRKLKGIESNGMIVAATALLSRTPKPTRDQVKQGMAGNLCRCGTHTRIIQAVMRAAQA
jgi:aerobic-type carbon monoxide dehydrogenase small subunit (CoxS/CutS family)